MAGLTFDLLFSRFTVFKGLIEIYNIWGIEK